MKFILLFNDEVEVFGAELVYLGEQESWTIEDWKKSSGDVLGTTVLRGDVVSGYVLRVMKKEDDASFLLNYVKKLLKKKSPESIRKMFPNKVQEARCKLKPWILSLRRRKMFLLRNAQFRPCCQWSTAHRRDSHPLP